MNETIEDVLTAKQERFCVNYTQNLELFGNATLSYAEAYGYDLDEQPTDDAKYEFKDGTVLFKYEIEDLKPTDVYNILNGKKVEESSYKKMYDSCSAYGSKVRKSLKIQKRCRELLNQFMNDEVIDARLTEIIIDGQASDSLSAIREYNKLKQRIIEKKDITTDGKPITISFDPAFK